MQQLPGHRSRSGCLTCRRRKVKCDETRPSCGKCSNKFRQCIWPDESISYTPLKRKTETLGSAAALGDQTKSTLDYLMSTTEVAIPFDFSSPRAGPSIQASAAPDKRFYIPPGIVPICIDKHPQIWLQAQPVDRIISPTRKAEMMADPSFLKPYFPSIDDRLVMRHFLLQTTKNLVAFGCQRRPWDPWVDFIVPLACNELPGHSLTGDALRTSILIIGAVHMRFCDDPTDQRGASRMVQTATTSVLSLVNKSIDAQDANSPLDKTDIEMILASLICLSVASSLAADDSWQELLNTITIVVERLGGAQVLLQEGSQEQLSSFRFFLEQLAVRDVFGCMTTQQAPRLLDTAFSPWFLEAEQWSRGDHEWESVERMFGISRGMVGFMARSCTLIHKVRKGATTSFSEDEFPLQLPSHAIARLPSQSFPPSDAMRNGLLAEAHDLLAELTVWYQACCYTPYHPRVQYGNHSYRHTVRIRLLREVYAVPMQDPSVQESVRAIMELATEMVCACGRITWLTWPILIAGLNMLQGDPNRDLALTLLKQFGRFACFDNVAACGMLLEHWAGQGAIIGGTPVASGVSKPARPFFD